MGWASQLVDSGARVDSITLLSFEVLGKVTTEKKRVSQAFRQKKIHYRKKERRKEGKKERKKERKKGKKERKKLALEKNQCPPFTDNPSYTLLMGNRAQKGGGLSLSLACSWDLVVTQLKGSHS